jgi:protein-tyrosine phosphatase
MPETKKRTRRTTHVNPADHIRRHSPIKNGLVVKDEDKPLEKYNKILPKLYLGNYQAAKDEDFFKSKKIKAVLNCTKDIPNYFASKKNMEYMRIPVDDSLRESDFKKMYEFFPAIVEFIYKHIVIQGDNTFIHCYAGRQRSGVAVAAYLVAKMGMTPADACKFIMDKRKEVFHFGLSLNFEDSLAKYYKDITKKCKK